MVRIEDWLSTIPSPHTRKNYECGIRKFEKYFGNGIETVIGSDDAGKIIDKYYVWLKNQGTSQNTCRNLVNAPIQFLKFFKTEVNYRNKGMYRTVLTTRDHLLNISEVQEMAKVADLREQVLLEVFLMGLRVSDVSKLEWKTFDVNSKPPVEIRVLTTKEDVVARTFISEEFQGLLQKYLDRIDKNNDFLFQSNRNGNLSPKRINQILKDLADRAQIKSHGLFRWHIGRKLFIRTCAELGVNAWNAKIMCGKSVSMDIATYISGVQLKNDFIKISNVLKLFPKPVANGQTKQMLDVVFQVLRTLVEDKMKENGLMLKTKPINWQAVYEKLLPEEEKPEHIEFT